jgi:hypothetical protein
MAAGYGQFVGYEPANGGANFITRDGKKTFIIGDPAEQLKARIDASAGLQPKLASNAPTPGPNSASYFPGLQSKLDAGALGTGIPPIKPQGAPAVVPLAAPTAAGGTPTAPAGAPPPQGAAPAAGNGLQPVGLGVYKDAQDNLYRMAPGSAPTKGGLQLRSQSQRGGFEPNQDYLDQLADQSIDEKLQAQDKADIETADTEQQRQLLEDQRRQIINDTIEANQRAAEKEARVSALTAKRDKAAETYANAKVDPGRAFSGGRNILAGLFAGIGAMAATKTGSPNYALQVYQQKSADDIRAQEDEIAVKKDAADNALKDLTQELGSRELAKNTLESVHLKQFQNAAQRAALTTQDQKTKLFMEQAQSAASAKLAEKMEQYRIQAGGEVDKQFLNVPGSAGSRGGPVMLSPSEAGNIAETLQKLHNPAAGAGGAPAPIPSERAERIAAMADSVMAAKEQQQMLGSQSSETDNPTFGLVDSWPSAEKNKLNSIARRLAAGAQAARGKSDKDAELAEEDALGNSSVNDRKRQAQVIADKSARGIAAELATLPEAQQQQILQSMDHDVAAAVGSILRPKAAPAPAPYVSADKAQGGATE